MLAIAILVPACTGDTGPAGPAGAPGTDGQNGSAGSAGSDGNDIILSVRAKHGLDIAPVMLDLAGKTGDQIEQIGQGSYLVNAVVDCSGCHNSPAQQYLAGGTPFVIDGSGDTVFSRNLTPDPTDGLKHTEAQFIETFQTGRDFHADQNGGNGLLIVMPWPNFRWLHTDDIKAIYAYLKAIPPVANPVPGDSKGPAAGLTPVALPTVYDRGETARPITPEINFMGDPIPDADGVTRGIEVNPLTDPTGFLGMDASAQAHFGRGAYLVNAAVCNDCHTNPPYGTIPGPTFLAVTPDDFLKGGAVFVTPPGLGPIFGTTRSMSKNLIGEATDTVSGFFNEGASTYLRFDEIITTGTHIDDPGQPPLAWPMPWDHFRNMETDDLVSLYTYLDTLAKQQPNTAANHNKQTQGAAIYCDATHACPGGLGYSCHTDTTYGNECAGNVCTSDADCGACQMCDTGGTNTCVPPGGATTPYQACALGAGI
jgi:hypothetical protein